MLDETARGPSLETGRPVRRDTAPGWIGLVCPNEAVAARLTWGVLPENVAVRRDGYTTLLPAGPGFRLEQKIENVVTAVAKTHHSWTEHEADASSASGPSPIRRVWPGQRGRDFLLGDSANSHLVLIWRR